MSDTTTKSIRIQVEPAFVPERSNQHEQVYFFSYQITITKEGYRSRFIKVDVKDLDSRLTESATIMLKEERTDLF